MSETKFTPGPWRLIAAPDDNHNHAITSDAPGYADSRIGWTDNNGTDEGRANGYLIAAAPDLYAACEAALAIEEQIRPGDSVVGRNDRLIAQLRDALAAARGEQ